MRESQAPVKGYPQTGERSGASGLARPLFASWTGARPARRSSPQTWQRTRPFGISPSPTFIATTVPRHGSPHEHDRHRFGASIIAFTPVLLIRLMNAVIVVVVAVVVLGFFAQVVRGFGDAKGHTGGSRIRGEATSRAIDQRRSATRRLARTPLGRRPGRGGPERRAAHLCDEGRRRHTRRSRPRNARGRSRTEVPDSARDHRPGLERVRRLQRSRPGDPSLPARSTKIKPWRAQTSIFRRSPLTRARWLTVGPALGLPVGDAS